MHHKYFEVKKNSYLDSALKLHQYIADHHWTGSQLIGPDPGIRWNFKIVRFPKSYLSFIPWKDDKYFLQGQGYWIIDNWLLFEISNQEKFKKIAVKCTNEILKQQHAEGYWLHPLPEWRDRIATVEGIYAALAMLYTYKYTQKPTYLESALKWYEFMTEKIGFLEYKDGLAIKYFFNVQDGLIPNNSTLTLTFLAELFDKTGDKNYLQYQDKLIKFLSYVQKFNGEFPYNVKTETNAGRAHLLCYQYNAFQFLDLIRYYEITENEAIFDILQKLAGFLLTGQNKNGSSKHKCHTNYPETNYYTAVLAAALHKAECMNIAKTRKQADKAYTRFMKHQTRKGGFPFSYRNWIILTDKRSYPRYLSMILKHLLLRTLDEIPGGKRI